MCHLLAFSGYPNYDSAGDLRRNPDKATCNLFELQDGEVEWRDVFPKLTYPIQHKLNP